MYHTTTKLLLLGSLALSLGACASDPSSNVGSDESNLTMSTSRTRALSEPIAVPTGSDVGRSIEELRAGLTAGIDPFRSSEFDRGESVCTVDDYAVAGYYYVNFQDCPDDSRILRGYQGGSFPAVVWADHDYDGLVDSWDDDDVDGSGFRHTMDDDNGDGMVDREAIDIELLGPDYVIEPFDGCEFPRAVAMRVLEDTDFDGYFDTESITAGRDAEGKSTYWICD
jgi:hypothetical protein